MASKRKITVDLPSSRKSRDRNERMERPATELKTPRDSTRSIDKDRSDRNERNNMPERNDDQNRSGDRERTSNKSTSSGSTGSGFQGDRAGSQRDRDRDRGGGETQQQRASVFSRLGKGPMSSSSVSKSSVAQQKGICRTWAETGQCPYGTECRYKHVASLVSPSKRSGSSHDVREAKDKDRDSGGRSAGQR